VSMLVAVFRELTGLFIDDGALALAILGVVLLAGLFVSVMPSIPLAGGGILLFGCLGLLVANVLRASHQ
jgi:uncharacterized membrane protein YccC